MVNEHLLHHSQCSYNRIKSKRPARYRVLCEKSVHGDLNPLLLSDLGEAVEKKVSFLAFINIVSFPEAVKLLNTLLNPCITEQN